MDQEKRDVVQTKSKERGHCVCFLLAKCPCPYFQAKDICHCAGEKHHESFEEWKEFNIVHRNEYDS